MNHNKKTEQARQRGKWSPRRMSKRNWVAYSKFLSPAMKNFIRGSLVNMQKGFSGLLAVRMNVCSPLPPNFIRWNLNSQCDSIRMWGLWDVIRSWGWSPHHGISTLIKETPESLLTPSAMCCSVARSCPALCDSMDCSTPGFLVVYCLPEPAQTHVHWVSDAIQPSHPLSAHSLPAFNFTQHQHLFNDLALLSLKLNFVTLKRGD